MTKLQRVFEPIQIGRVTIPNRIVRTPHGTSLAHGNVNDTLIAYHVARARGGVGLSYIEYTSVHPSSISIGTYSWDDSHIDGWNQAFDDEQAYLEALAQEATQ